MDNENNTPIISNDLRQAVADIKHAIVVSQSRALRMISGQQLSLYFGIGRYVSGHSRGASWGSSAIDTISQQLQREMPGLRILGRKHQKNAHIC